MAYITVSGLLPGYGIIDPTDSDGDASSMFDFGDRAKAKADAIAAKYSALQAAKESLAKDPTAAKKAAVAKATSDLVVAQTTTPSSGFSISPMMLVIGAGVAYFAFFKKKKGGGRKRRKR